MLRKILRLTFVASTVLLVLLTVRWVLITWFPARGCALFGSAVEDMRVLIISVETYYSSYKRYPSNLAALGPPPAGQPFSEENAGMIDSGLASGNKWGYVFRYLPERESHRQKSIVGFRLTADPIIEGSRKHHYFADDSGVLRADGDRPASAASPQTHDSSCSCAGPEDYVGPEQNLTRQLLPRP